MIRAAAAVLLCTSVSAYALSLPEPGKAESPGPVRNTPADKLRSMLGLTKALALELAAARVPALGLVALLERLDDRFRLLKLAGRAAEPRHNTLHAAFDWSYSLLPLAEQRIFNLLGTFTGSFSLRAAAKCVVDESTDPGEAVDLISRLVDRSLVTVLAVEPPRYTLLETAREVWLTLPEIDDPPARFRAGRLAFGPTPSSQLYPETKFPPG